MIDINQVQRDFDNGVMLCRETIRQVIELAASQANSEEAEYELVQDDMVVAGVSGPDALKEIRHYAAQYVQDGPVRIIKVSRYVIADLELPSASKDSSCG